MRPAQKTLLLATALLLLLTLAACGGTSKKTESGAAVAFGSVTTTRTGEATPAAPNASATAAASATPPGLPQPAIGVVLQAVVLPKFNVQAPVETKGLNSRNEMEDPSGKDAVAWYDFSEFPGFGGNAVFSGHVDWYTGEIGPFGRIRDLKEGDQVDIKLSDGTTMTYKIVGSQSYESAKAPVAEIVARTERDTLTFITCEGSFDRRTQDYSNRRIVRAERVS